MEPFETIYIDDWVVACNGGGGPLGHPRVYLNLAPAGRVECPYCSRLYLNRAVAGLNRAAAGLGAEPGAGSDPPHGPQPQRQA
ncbi:MAG: zinc-finger domain-containing protein [Stellaceae bacterium]